MARPRTVVDFGPFVAVFIAFMVFIAFVAVFIAFIAEQVGIFATQQVLSTPTEPKCLWMRLNISNV